MKVDIWMPVYIGDYLSDTLDLRAIGHGCYFLLLMHYWKKGELVKDPKKLMTIARLDADEAYILDEILLNYFEEKGGKYYQKRADEEIKKANSRRTTATENGKKGGRPHKIDNPQETGGFSDNNPKGNPEKSSSPSPLPLPIESKKREKAHFVPPTQEQVTAYAEEMGYTGLDSLRFISHHTSSGWMVGKKKMKDWKSAVVTWHLNDVKYSDKDSEEKKKMKEFIDAI